MSARVARFEITAMDARAAREFYAALFGWTITPRGKTGISAIEPGEGPPGAVVRAEAGSPTFVTVYVEVDDVERALAEAEKLGGTVYVPAGPSPFPDERCFGIFGDPEGNLIGVVQR